MPRGTFTFYNPLVYAGSFFLFFSQFSFSLVVFFPFLFFSLTFSVLFFYLFIFLL